VRASLHKRMITHPGLDAPTGRKRRTGAEEAFVVTVHVNRHCFGPNKSHNVAISVRQGDRPATPVSLHRSTTLPLIVITWRRAEVLRIAHCWTWR
jgi:hypothetical protein